MAFTGRLALLDKPMSVEQIVKSAGEPFFDAQFSMQNWFRTADLMLKQANIYEHEGNDQMAYFLLYRHAHLVLDELAKHPDARAPEHRAAWSEARKAVKRSLAKLELLKPRINKRHGRYEDRQRVLAARATSSVNTLTDGMRKMSMDTSRSRPSSSHRDEPPAKLDTIEHSDMAVDLANREMRRRAARAQNTDYQSLDTSLVALRRQLDAPSAQMKPAEQMRTPAPTTTYNYPHVPEHHGVSSTDILPGDDLHERSQTANFQPPPRPPPKELDPQRNNNNTTQPLQSTAPPPLPGKTRPSPPSTPPTTYTTPRQFATTAHLESGAPLRTIFLPSPLRHTFVRFAHANTSRNLETCGILCGTLLQNAFFITRLVIPEQTSTSDTCEMINEAALYEYIDAQPEDLMVLGWIHTHPTQTCFMSSRDLHTHVWYQVSLPESIAIVCAPSKDPEWGIFRLTDPPGMGAIRSCKQPGIFHPHAEGHIFTDALGRPGHVIEHRELQFEVVDLRVGK